METVLFGVVPVLVFMGLAVRSALRGRFAPAEEPPAYDPGVPDAGQDAPDAPGPGGADRGLPEYKGPRWGAAGSGGRGTDTGAARPDTIEPTRGGR